VLAKVLETLLVWSFVSFETFFSFFFKESFFFVFLYIPCSFLVVC
jgi:hypothetical protein